MASKIPTSIAADGPDFLDPPLAWTPSQRFGHGQAYEYRLALGADDVAILQLIPGKGWAMTTAHGTAQPDERGLFATPRDALMVLIAEFVITDADGETQAGAVDSPPAQIASGSDESNLSVASPREQHASLQAANQR